MTKYRELYILNYTNGSVCGTFKHSNIKHHELWKALLINKGFYVEEDIKADTLPVDCYKENRGDLLYKILRI